MISTKQMQTLSSEAHVILCNYLRSKGNRLSEDHIEALRALVCSMSAYVLGSITGRKAFPLATGLGKTSAIKAWIKALHKNNINHVGIAVAAGKVEALAELKQDLMDMGVPASKIGILHSYEFNPKKAKEGQEGYASMPSTDIDQADKQFMLVTHQRIKNCPKSLELFNNYQGEERRLLIWDESLITSKPISVITNLLKAETAYLEVIWNQSSDKLIKETLSYLKSCNKIIDSKLKEQSKDDNPMLIDLPKVNPDKLNDMRLLINRQRLDVTNTKTLLEVCSEKLRVTKLGQGGVINYQVSVPEELKNILILDASYPVRELMKLDDTIENIGESFKLGTSVSLDKIKNFSKVKINHMKAGGGRASMEKAFGDTKVINDIVKVILETPEDDDVLVFVYKKKKLDMKMKLLKALRKAKVNTSRVSIATWGQETSSNEWANHKHVILAGILQQSHQQLAAAYIGQVDNLYTEINYKKHIKPIALSESTHLAYQAASRGHCRIVDKGEAGDMTLWLIHFDNGIENELLKVMPNADWSEWIGDYSKTKEAASSKIEELIKGFLKKLPESESKISSVKLKKALGGSDYPARTWSRAFTKVGNSSDWLVQGRTLVRTTEVFR
jgi:hypothetical protein